MNTEETQPDVSRRFRDVQHQLGEKAKHVGQVTDEYVHDNAWKSIALVALIGLFVGYLIGNRE